MSYKIAPLTVNPGQKSNIISRVFVSQPSAEEELLVGRLFVLLELEIERPDDVRIADFLVAEAYREYYENEAFLLRDRLSNLKPELIFEAAVAKLNRNLAEFIEKEKMKFKYGALNAVIGILHGNKLFFAQTGNSKALLLYRPKNKQGELLPDFSLVDITEKTNDPTQEIVQTNKFFTNVVAGAVPIHGCFFFANEALFEYLTKKQVTDIVTTLPPSGAAEQMKNLLEQTNAFVPFFGLIIKNSSGERDAFAAPAASMSVPGTLPTGAGRSSVHQLNLTQEKTEQLLSASGMVNVKKWLGRFKPVSTDIKSYAKDRARQFNLVGERMNIQRRGMDIGKKTIALAGAVVSISISAVQQTAKVATDKDSRQAMINGLKLNAQRGAQATVSAIERFNKLSKKNKTLLIIIAICILGLLGNIIYSGIIKSRQAAQQQIALVSSQFSQKEGQLEAALLYNNKEGAKQVLDEMQQLIATLPNKTAQDKARVADFKSRYEKHLDGIYNIIRLGSAAPLLDLPNDADYLLADNGKVFVASSSAKTIWRIKSDKTLEGTAKDAFPNGPIIGASADSPNEYYIGTSSTLSYNPNNGQSSVISITNVPNTIEGAAVYNNRLYLASSGHIYRFSSDKSANAFSGRSDWLKGSDQIGTVSSLAIDGNIYIIENNKLAKFSGGQRAAIALDNVSPALEAPTQVSVSQDLDFMYILEPKHQRLLVYSKNGKYLAQYTGDQLTNLKAATVDQQNKAVYLLNGKTIYKIDAKHFTR